MTDSEKANTSGHPARLGKVAAFVLPIFLAVGLAWYLFPSTTSSAPSSAKSATPKSVAPPQPAQPPVYAYARPLTLAVAQRRGRCRAMNYHLSKLAEAKKKSDVDAELKFLGLLAGEMMNSYPQRAVTDSGSNALPVVSTPEGQRELSEARDNLRETVRSARGLGGKEAAARVADSCLACHVRFMRNGGKVLPPLGKFSSEG